MKATIPPLYISLFLHIVIQLVSGHPLPIYTPVEDITLNCGYSGSVQDFYSGRNWTGDINSNYSPIEVGNTTSQVEEAPPSFSSASQVPYTTARLSRYQFMYRFNHLTAGPKFIRLYFNPASYPNFDRSKALFSVKAGRFTLLQDFNASVTADAAGAKTIYREFCLNIDEEESINITFSPSKAKDAYAFINGVEIVSMPTNLYYSSARSHRVKNLSHEVNYYIENSTALEMVYRINVGGSPILPSEDSGMYREWDAADDIYLDYLSKSFSVLPHNDGYDAIELNFKLVPEYSAPKAVYVTGRSMGTNKTVNKSYNLTWVFPVDSNFSYLVRLHFCEFEPQIISQGDRSFLIYIANITAEGVADIIKWSGGNGIPIYRDYYVHMTGPVNQTKVNLFLALQSNPCDWLTLYSDAILNGLEIFKLNNSIGNLAGPNPYPPTKGQKMPTNNSTPMPAIVVGVVSSILLVLVFSLLGFMVFRQGRQEVKNSGSSCGMTNASLPSHLCHYFSLAEIKAATQNFNETSIIGIGGFGNVYKGCIDDGATLVAIKRQKATSSQGAREFVTEIEMLSRLRHRHLVSLIGYCADEGEMILVYDYMARGTLSDHLYQTENPHLPWEQRLQICIGAAQGLHYLHMGTKGTIIHRDVKSTNILLDEKWIAKVSDFGLSKMGNITVSNTHISTVVKGSFGYLDPEYYRRQQLTEKSDVYSFGVVLCEVLCGRPAVTTVENDRIGLAKWAKKCHGNGEIDQIIDPNLKDKIATQCLLKYISIAMSCLDDDGVNRPSIIDVVRGLEFALQLQLKNEECDHCMEMIFQNETALVMDNEGSFCSGANESVQGLTGTIFSEIIDPVGR
ncbi:hypothetical protein M0R45_033228 [Rubus argutus]|uniref:Protein kinase domain-containing protein n=1 Tax=Rubus argutus TaxID=59490 RepID=A0AAW1WKJ4_RUBAR